MALYKNANYVKSSTGSEFDSTHSPGANTPVLGDLPLRRVREGDRVECRQPPSAPEPPPAQHQRGDQMAADRPDVRL